MKYNILLDSHENTSLVEEEEKGKFVRSILEAMNIDLEDWPVEEELTIDNKIKLRDTLKKYNVSVITHHDGVIEIFLDSDLIAKWNKPYYMLKKDECHVDPRKRLYLEMQVNSWSIFEEEKT